MWASYLAVALSTTLGVDPSTSADPCEATVGHEGYTLLLERSGEFVHCRHGETTDTPPVSNERVVLQLPPVDPREPFHFRLVQPNQARRAVHPQFLAGQIAAAQAVENELNALLNAPQSISAVPLGTPAGGPAPAPAPAEPPTREHHRHISEAQMPNAVSPASAPALREAEIRRLQFLGLATPAFAAALRSLGDQLPDLERAAADVDEACATKADGLPVGPLREAVDQECEGGGPGTALLKALRPFEEQRTALAKARHAARDALYAVPPNGSAGEQQTAALAASLALQDAITAADRLLDQAPALARTTDAFVQASTFLQVALSIPPAAIAGLRLRLGRFPAAGLFSSPVVYQVEVTRVPSKLFASSATPAQASAPAPTPNEEAAGDEALIDRFQPIARRFFSLELALVYSTGLPDHPALVGRLGQETLKPVATQGFAGGVLASLEPLEFAYPERAWAGLLRFPVIIVPFTLDPLTNYFLGGGIGWTDVGSITLGVHLALTTVPAPGTPYGTVFTTSPIELGHVTQTGPFAGGLFVGASLDLLGIVHLFLSERQPVVRDAVTGADLGSR